MVPIGFFLEYGFPQYPDYGAGDLGNAIPTQAVPGLPSGFVKLPDELQEKQSYPMQYPDYGGKTT